MGFAKLVFKADGTETVNNVLADIFNTLTGTTTSASNLVTANKTSSYIYNSAGRGNWTVEYGTSLPRVLRAVCLNGQNKFIQIGQAGWNREITNATGSTLYRYVVQAASTNGGIQMRSATAASSAATVTNPSFVNIDTVTATQNFWNAITGPEIYLSWSLRHCLIAGGHGGLNTKSNYCISACFEYNEDGINDNKNTAPFCHAQWFSNVAASATSPTYSGANAFGQSTFSVMNHFRPDTAVSTGARNIAGELTPNVDFSTILVVNSSLRPAIMTKTASGASAMYLQPLYWNQHAMGIPHLYISDLCKVYGARGSPGEAGDTITVGSDTYVYIPWGAGDKGIVCLRA